MNKNIKAILAMVATALLTGCATAGTWVNGYYVDGPLCTVCDGTRTVTHAYGTTVCTHCDGTGIEPPEETVVVENIVVEAWRPMPPPRPIVRRHKPPPRAKHGNAKRPKVRPQARPAARPARRTHRR